MGRKPPLTYDQVQEILGLYNRGMKPWEIGPKFDRAENTIRKIVEGESYRGATGREHTVNGLCVCHPCMKRRRQDANVDRAFVAEGEFRCVGCNAVVIRRVSDVQHAHGLVRCPSCDRRRK